MIIFIITLYIAFGAWLVKHRHPPEPEAHSEPPEVNFSETAERVEQLHRTVERLRTVEELITDLEICTPNEYEKPISIEWVSAAGNTRRYDLWIDGRANSERMLLVAYAERERLRTSLLAQVDGLKAGGRSYANSYANGKLNSRGGDKYDA